MERIIQGVAASFRCKAEFEYERLAPLVINDPWAYEVMQGSFRKVVNSPDLILEAPKTMVAEDFGYFGDKLPIIWVRLGAYCGKALHTSTMAPDESALVTGAACYAQFALDALEKLNAET